MININPETLNTIIKDCTRYTDENKLYFVTLADKYFSMPGSIIPFIQELYFNPFLMNIAEKINHMDKADYFKLLGEYIEAKQIPQDNMEG